MERLHLGSGAWSRGRDWHGQMGVKRSTSCRENKTWCELLFTHNVLLFLFGLLEFIVNLPGARNPLLLEPQPYTLFSFFPSTCPHPFLPPSASDFPIFPLSLSVYIAPGKDDMMDIFNSSPFFHPMSWRECWGLKSQVLSVPEPPGGNRFLWLPPSQHLTSCLTSDSLDSMLTCWGLLWRVRCTRCVTVVMPHEESKGALDWLSWKQTWRWRVASRIYWDVPSEVIPVGG